MFYRRSLFMLYSLRHIAPQSKFAHELHLDIFEHIIPPTLIADVLTETQHWEKREKGLNMPMVIAIIIAMGLLASCSIPHVLHKLSQGLRYIWPDPDLRLPGASAISQRRQQLGVQPLRRLFERVCLPRATPQTPGAFAFGLRLMAIDSTVEKVADTFANVLTFGSPSNQNGCAAYPQVRGIYLMECATHLMVDACFRPYRPNELLGAFALLRSIQPGMLVLSDRGFHSARLIQVMRAMRAHVLGRLASNVVPRYLRQLCDGTYLAALYPADDTAHQLGRPLLVRILEYTLDDPQRPGHGDVHRLVTTLLNPRTVGARELIICYHERWELEIAIDDIDTHQRLCDYTLRSQTPQGVEQELYGILLGYYAVRALMLQAAEQGGLDSDRLSFTHAITLITDAMPEFQQTAPQQREALTQRLLRDLRDPLLPPRRWRSTPRVCKQAGSKFPRPRPEHRQLPKLEHAFAEVIVVLTHSTRYQGPLPIKRFPRIVLLI
jgi:Insertion element 4 transposase N-terminal/Transposase DDE domain